MLGDMFNNNKRKDVCTREDQRKFMGRKYSKEEATGYYVSTTINKKTGKRNRLHIDMWCYAHGVEEVPEGCVIHHIDWNKNNNTIENLVCVTVEEHEQIHNKIGGEEGKKLGERLASERNKKLKGYLL